MAVPPPTRTRYGAANPERVENELWELATRNNWSGYMLQQHVASKSWSNRRDFSHSSYRDSEPGPFWSWDRFGRTSTKLADGRIIHIAGEHEDWYDPDFCIYNDVVVEHPDGRREFYLYPKDVFPPTDFHSATLIGGEILLIGSLGYQDLRRVGETQVLKLDTRTLCIAPVMTKGEGPGWISRHTADRIGDTTILILGGNAQTAKDYETNTGIFELDLATWTWRRGDPGDAKVFPVPDEIYRTHRSPHYGAANPERSDNPFWHEMARRQWPPSRARLHFGDLAPEEPRHGDLADAPTPEFGTSEFEAWVAQLSARIKARKLSHGIGDIVWTAVREESLKMALPDGRALVIGGEITDHGDEHADPWVYNDIVVTHPDGAIEILTYPKDIFPHLLGATVGVFHDRNIYIFGYLDWDRHPGRSWGATVLRLDTESYRMAELPVAPPPEHPNIDPGLEFRSGTRVVFPVVRQESSDPLLGIAFDLGTLTWSAPFPHPHAGGAAKAD